MFKRLWVIINSFFVIIKWEFARNSTIEKNQKPQIDFLCCFSESPSQTEYNLKFLEISDVRNSF